MEERGGRYILSEEELALFQQEALHPNADALRKRDRFLASFSDIPISFAADGGMSFVLPIATEQVRIEHISILGITGFTTYNLTALSSANFLYRVENNHVSSVA